jgi:hypothetical protein
LRLDILGKAPFFQLVGIEFEKTSSSATAAGLFLVVHKISPLPIGGILLTA